MGTQVAVKVIKSSKGIRPAFDGIHSGALSHPNIVQTFVPHWETPVTSCSLCAVIGDTWMVQEWCDRGSLTRYCAEVRRSESVISEVLGIGADVASAGQYIHSQDLIHGNLTTDSVLLKTDTTYPKGYVCKLGDLHIAHGKINDACLQGSSSRQSHPWATRKADIYSTGIILWQVLTGRQKFIGLTDAEVASEVSGLHLDEAQGGLIRGIIESCIAKKPAERPEFHDLVKTFMNISRLQTITSGRARQLEADLEKLVATAASGEKGSELATPCPRKVSRRVSFSDEHGVQDSHFTQSDASRLLASPSES
jgi:serine/threonine protein kinase